MAEKLTHIAKIIRERRHLLGYTQSDLAELTGLSDRTIRHIEKGELGGAVGSWLKVLDVLGLELKVNLKLTGNEEGKGIL